jgi:hypothetical protein
MTGDQMNDQLFQVVNMTTVISAKMADLEVGPFYSWSEYFGSPMRVARVYYLEVGCRVVSTVIYKQCWPSGLLTLLELLRIR